MATFEIVVRGDLQTKLARARAAARRNGVMMTGDTRSGRFSGLISGSYEVSGGIVTVTITEKPFIVSWDQVERQLRGFLEG